MPNEAHRTDRVEELVVDIRSYKDPLKNERELLVEPERLAHHEAVCSQGTVDVSCEHLVHSSVHRSLEVPGEDDRDLFGQRKGE